MRVLSITPTFFPQLGGLEQVVLELARRVPEHGIQMDVAHVAAGLPRLCERVHDVTVFRVPLRGNRMVGWASSLPELARGYDLLHVHDPQLLAISGNVRWLCRGIPAVLSTHGGFWHTDSGYWFKRGYEATFLRGYAGSYRRILATSVSDLEYFKRFAARVELCSNGVDVKSFYGVPAPGPLGPYRWIYWGRLSRNKRVDLAIAYVAHARALGHPVELLVCGQDFDLQLPALEAQVARLGLTGAVRFEPYLSNAALLAELAQRTVYITASEHEGFGLSVVEAMAAGRIVICRNMAPLNGFVRHAESGWFLSFDGSPQDLEALGAFLESSAVAVSAMSSAARLTAGAHDWDVVTPRFVRHYREAACT